MFKNLELKVGIFVVSIVLLMLLSVVFIAYKKGAFEEMYELKLSSASGDGITEGMPVLFSGFEVGKITKMELTDTGIVVLHAKIPSKHAKWINESSDFILNKPLIGSPKIIIKTANLQAKPITKDKIPQLKTVDGINEAIARVQPVLERVEEIVKNVEKITGTMSNKTSIVAMATGRNESGDDLAQILRKSAELSESLHSVINKTDERLYGKEGMIKDLELSLKRLDEILKNASKISADVAASTTDLVALRTEIDVAVRNANSIMNEIDSKIPLKTKKEVKLP